jgi:hypothetical protein
VLLLRQRQRRDDADRATAGNEDRALGRHFPAFYGIRFMSVLRPKATLIGPKPRRTRGE